VNAREQAYAVLQRVELEGAHAAPLLDDAEPFARALTLGIIRWRARLDAIIAKIADRSPRKIDQRVLQILRIGVYQILDMDVALHAAVNETVQLAAQHAPRARGFVNAVLRKAASAERAALELGLREDELLGHPAWLLDRWRRAYGNERAHAIAASNQQLSFPDVVVNSARIDRGAMRLRLAERGIVAEESRLVESVLRLQAGTAELAGEIEQGLLYPMDEGSAVVASLVRGPRVLDLTAAPGGKSLVMRMRGLHVTSNDVSMSRLLPLRAAHRRIFGAAARLTVSDGRRTPFRGGFDSILLDAPCSATGTIRKNPEVKWRVDEPSFGVFATLQRELLTGALDLAPAECIYATCSLEHEENEDVVHQVLERRDDYELFDLAESAPPAVRAWTADGALRLTPESGTDGFTAFGMRRCAKTA
jgi:16S rRNA (cytosine967-C5)-methyltransferase